jgi:uracil-DNA glycosylase
MKNAALSLFPPVVPDPAALPFADYDYPAKRQSWSGIILVGEAPGADEARLGRPFVGRSGQLLDKALQQAGIERPRALVANVFRYQPPGNKIDHFFMSQRAAKTAGETLDEKFGKFSGKFCRTKFNDEILHLKKTLADWQPRVIIALGRTPFWALTGLDGLLKSVGQPLACRLYDGCSVLPTYHPSFILRGNWGLQPNWNQHLQLAIKLATK